MSRKNDVQRYNDFISLLLPNRGARHAITDKAQSKYDYISYMLDRTQQMFKYTNLPETIPARELELLLQVNGFACIAHTNGNLYAFFGGLGGVPDPYYRPTKCVVNNPALNFNESLTIDENCIIIKNDAMLSGLVPMFGKYAELLTENDITFRIASINGRLSSIISAGDSRTADAAKNYIKDIEDGKLGVIAEQSLIDGLGVHQAGTSVQNRITDLIEYNQYLKASWFNDLGIEANYNMKRESLNADEVKLNVKALLPLAENMLICRQDGVEKVNKMFGTDIHVEFASVWKDTQKDIDELNQITDDQADANEQTAVDDQDNKETGENEDEKAVD